MLRQQQSLEKNGTATDPKGVSVYAWKGETLAEYWWCTLQALLCADLIHGPILHWMTVVMQRP